MPTDTSSLSRAIHRFASDVVCEREAKQQAKALRDERIRDFLVEYEEKVRQVIEPLFGEVERELRSAGFDGVNVFLLDSDNRVSLSLDGETDSWSLSYNRIPDRYDRIEAVLGSDRESDDRRVELALTDITAERVRQDVRALLSCSRGKLPDARWERRRPG